MTVQTQLDPLWAGVVNAYEFDLLNRNITFQVTVIDGGNENHHELVFSQVASFYFVNDEGEERLEFPPVEPGDYIELTSVSYVPERLGQVSATVTSTEWETEPHRFPAFPNFVMEIWSSWLLIEALLVRVDGISLPV